MNEPDPLAQFRERVEEFEPFMFCMTTPRDISVTVTFDFVPESQRD